MSWSSSPPARVSSTWTLLSACPVSSSADPSVAAAGVGRIWTAERGLERFGLSPPDGALSAEVLRD